MAAQPEATPYDELRAIAWTGSACLTVKDQRYGVIGPAQVAANRRQKLPDGRTIRGASGRPVVDDDRLNSQGLNDDMLREVCNIMVVMLSVLKRRASPRPRERIQRHCIEAVQRLRPVLDARLSDASERDASGLIGLDRNARDLAIYPLDYNIRSGSPGILAGCVAHLTGMQVRTGSK